MALQSRSHSVHPLGSLRWVRWLAYHLLSFETFFLLFFYGTHIRQILPPIPGNEAFVFGIITLAIGGWIIIRDGLYLRGLPILLTGLAFIGWIILSIGWTPSRILAMESLSYLLTINLWALFAGACIIAGSRERALRLFVMIMLLALLLAVIGIYIEFTYGSFRFYAYRGGTEIWAPVYIHWGNIVANGGVVALAIVVYSRLGSLKQLLSLTILGVCVYFLLIAGGRGPLLAICLTGFVVMLLQLPRISAGRFALPQTQLLALLIMAVGIAYVGYLFATGQSIYTLNRFLTLFEQADDPLLRRGANRFDYFAGAYSAWLTAPFIGLGLHGFAIYFCNMEDPGCHAHNAILQTLADFGIIGLVFFVGFVWSGIRLLTFARLRNDPLFMVLLMIFITFIVQVMVSGDITTNYRFFFIVGLLALRPLAEEVDEEKEVEEDEGR